MISPSLKISARTNCALLPLSNWLFARECTVSSNNNNACAGPRVLKGGVTMFMCMCMFICMYAHVCACTCWSVCMCFCMHMYQAGRQEGR